jgi:hypothetical protein
MSPAQTELHDIPVGRSELLQIRERTSAERDGFADAEPRTRAGCSLGRVHARAPFQPLPRIKRRHMHSHNERSFKAEFSCGAITRTWIVRSLLQ